MPVPGAATSANEEFLNYRQFMIANDAVAEDGHAPHFEGSLGFISLPRLESRAVRGLQSLGMKPNASIRYTGEVVYIYAFDVAYDTARKPIRELLGQPAAP